MPFAKNSDLPANVKKYLPEQGQEIYKEAFNSAWDQYDKPEERREGRDREETAHAVAWAAVKNIYEKNKEGEWVKKHT